MSSLPSVTTIQLPSATPRSLMFSSARCLFPAKMMALLERPQWLKICWKRSTPAVQLVLPRSSRTMSEMMTTLRPSILKIQKKFCRITRMMRVEVTSTTSIPRSQKYSTMRSLCCGSSSTQKMSSAELVCGMGISSSSAVWGEERRSQSLMRKQVKGRMSTSFSEAKQEYLSIDLPLLTCRVSRELASPFSAERNLRAAASSCEVDEKLVKMMNLSRNSPSRPSASLWYLSRFSALRRSTFLTPRYVTPRNTSARRALLPIHPVNGRQASSFCGSSLTQSSLRKALSSVQTTLEVQRCTAMTSLGLMPACLPLAAAVLNLGVSSKQCLYSSKRGSSRGRYLGSLLMWQLMRSKCIRKATSTLTRAFWFCLQSSSISREETMRCRQIPKYSWYSLRLNTYSSVGSALSRSMLSRRHSEITCYRLPTPSSSRSSTYMIPNWSSWQSPKVWRLFSLKPPTMHTLSPKWREMGSLRQKRTCCSRGWGPRNLALMVKESQLWMMRRLAMNWWAGSTSSPKKGSGCSSTTFSMSTIWQMAKALSRGCTPPIWCFFYSLSTDTQTQSKSSVSTNTLRDPVASRTTGSLSSSSCCSLSTRVSRQKCCTICWRKLLRRLRSIRSSLELQLTISSYPGASLSSLIGTEPPSSMRTATVVWPRSRLFWQEQRACRVASRRPRDQKDWWQVAWSKSSPSSDRNSMSCPWMRGWVLRSVMMWLKVVSAEMVLASLRGFLRPWRMKTVHSQLWQSLHFLTILLKASWRWAGCSATSIFSFLSSFSTISWKSCLFSGEVMMSSSGMEGEILICSFSRTSSLPWNLRNWSWRVCTVSSLLKAWKQRRVFSTSMQLMMPSLMRQSRQELSLGLLSMLTYSSSLESSGCTMLFTHPHIALISIMRSTYTYKYLFYSPILPHPFTLQCRSRKSPRSNCRRRGEREGRRRRWARLSSESTTSRWRSRSRRSSECSAPTPCRRSRTTCAASRTTSAMSRTSTSSKRSASASQPT